MDLVNYRYLDLTRCHMGHPMLPPDVPSNTCIVAITPWLVGVHKVDASNSAIDLHWTLKFEWYVVKVRLQEHIPKRVVFRRDWYTCSTYHNLSRLNSRHDRYNIWPLNEQKKSLLWRSNKIFIWAPKFKPHRFGFANYLVLTLSRVPCFRRGALVRPGKPFEAHVP